MASLGQRLREARERQGGGIGLIAAQLRISARYLEAIEADDVSILPGGFFTRSFYRQYAQFLGLSETQIQAELDGLLAAESTPFLPGQEPRKEGSDLPPLPSYADRRVQNRKVISAVAALVVVVAGCAAAYRVWQSRDTAPAPPEAATVHRDAVSVAEPSPQAAEPSQDRSEGPLRLELEADEDVWVSITAGGETVFTGLLRRSETKQLTGFDEARMRVGNAGGIRIYWNGKPVGPIGPRGQIRIVKFTPEGPIVTNPREDSPKPAGAAAPSSSS